jgi:UDP-N-acetylmuramoyl-tripeptide--D-alanyl-D-alanine ligase
MMELSEAARIVNGKLRGIDAVFTAVTTDSRAIDQGDLFIAIPGENFDGHNFVPEAGQKGAAGAIVSSPIDTELAQIEVPDTTRALGELASQWRSRFDIPVLAITGSNGKTTVTAMTASILNHRGNCLSPERSFNNQWGVPLTLLRLKSGHDFAVIEMGTNHMGEIDYLSKITRPTVAVITNVASAHLEGLNSLEQIAEAKAEIFSGLNESGAAVINIDDRFSRQWHDQASVRLKQGRVITFGIENPADVSVSNLQPQWFSSAFDLHINEQCQTVTLPLPGRHNVMNALASAAICHAAGVSMADIKEGLESAQGVAGRLDLKQGIRGSLVIDDSYNANPQSIKAGIDVLSEFQGKKILVLGAMAELGQASSQLHREVGQYAKRNGVETLFCLVPKGVAHGAEYAAGFGEGAQVYDSIDPLVSALENHLDNNVAVLVKGSRSSTMERVVAEIIERDHAGDMPADQGRVKQRGNAQC